MYKRQAWPRELSIAGSGEARTRRLIQTPTPLPTGPEGFTFDGPLDGLLTLPPAASEAPALIEVEVERGRTTRLELTLGLTVAWEADTLTVRPRIGLSDNPVGFDRKVATPLTGDLHQFAIIVDHGSVEVFIDGGRTVLTQLCPPALLDSPWTIQVSGDPAQIQVRTRPLS